MMAIFIEHFGPLCIMAALVFTSQAANRRMQSVRQRRESQGLRRALYISVKALRKLYSRNLETLCGGNAPLISGRQQLGLLRVYLGRIYILEESEIDLLVLAVIAAESAETAMAMWGKAFGGAAFAAPAGDEGKYLVRPALESVISALAIAAAKFCPHEEGGAPMAIEEDSSRPQRGANAPIRADGDDLGRRSLQ